MSSIDQPMQNHEKVQDSHQLSPPFDPKKPGMTSSEGEIQSNFHDRHHFNVHEEQSKISGSLQNSENGEERDESLEPDHERTDNAIRQSLTKNEKSVKDEQANEEEETEAETEPGPRERLKRHRKHVAGQVWIPDMWGQEELLKDLIDCSAFDSCLISHQDIVSARASLVEEVRRASSGRLGVQNSC